jgi:hypothetical protein
MTYNQFKDVYKKGIYTINWLLELISVIVIVLPVYFAVTLWKRIKGKFRR